ncbi:MAG: hypothetical protein ACRD29_12260 [Acidimicrobiales bacterium]
MSELDTSAEITKLARLLEIEEDRLDFLADSPAEPIRHLREQLTDALFDEHRPLFRRLAAASKLVPPGLTTRFAVRLFGPRLSAGVAGEMPAGRAIDLARRLPAEFLADTSVEVDPHRIPDLVSGMPVDRIIGAARVLRERGEYVTMGRFVDTMSDDATVEVIDDLDDSEALLRIAFFAENKPHLDAVCRLLSDDHLRGLMAAAEEHDLWTEALALLVHLSDSTLGRLGDLASEMDEAILTSLVRVVVSNDRWPVVLSAVRHMAEPNQKKLAGLAALDDDGVLTSIVGAGHDHNLWAEALPLLGLLDGERQGRLADVAASMDDSVLDGLVRVVVDEDRWPVILGAIRHLSDAGRQKLATLAALDDDTVLTSISRSAHQHDLWEAALPFLAILDDDHRRRIAALAADMDPEVIQGAIAAADRTGEVDTLLDLLEQLDDDSWVHLLERADEVTESLLRTCLDAAEHHDAWPRVLELMARQNERVQQGIGTAAARLRDDEYARLRARAESLGLWPRLDAVEDARSHALA